MLVEEGKVSIVLDVLDESKTRDDVLVDHERGNSSNDATMILRWQDGCQSFYQEYVFHNLEEKHSLDPKSKAINCRLKSEWHPRPMTRTWNHPWIIKFKMI